MTTSATPETPAAAPLDAERARLRSAGYTDAEITHILTQREIGASPQQSAGSGQGVMSNVLSSIVAVASHARAVVPSFRKDMATVFDGAATASARAGAAASLAVKVVVILVLGYAAWQEWQIHIVYQAQIQRNHGAATAADALLKTQDAIAAQKSLEQMSEEIREQDRARGVVPDDLSCNQPSTAQLNDAERKAIAAGHCVTLENGHLVRHDAAATAPPATAPRATVPDSPLHSLGYDPK